MTDGDSAAFGNPQPPLRVTIVNCYPDHNKGSSALAIGLITRLRRTGLVGNVSIISLHRHLDVEVDFRHLIQLCPDVDIYPSPLRDQPRPHAQKVRRLANKAGYTAYILGRTIAVRAESAIRTIPSLDALKRSDLVLERGGPFFKGAGIPPNPSLLRYAWPLRFAQAANIPYALVGESVGPLENAWAKREVRRLVVNAGLTSVREDLSRATLIEAGVPVERFTTMLDNAFWIEPRRSANVERVLAEYELAGKRVLAVTCRDYSDKTVEAAYLREMAAAIDELVPATFDVAAVVLNTFNPAGPNLDDRRMSRNLLEMVARKDLVRIVDADLAPDELVALYHETDLLIGRRLHSLILALVGGTPVVGIASSSPKTTGVLQLLGLHDYVLPIRGLRSADLVGRARRAVTEQDGVPARIKTLRDESDAVFDASIERLARARRQTPVVG